MLTVADIQNVTFEKAVRGYRAEDVDEFLAHVARELEAIEASREEAEQGKQEAIAAAARQKEDLEKKVYILAGKIEEYRKDEDNLKTALLNAQRLCESVVNEAKQKAETILGEAKQKAEIVANDATAKAAQMEHHYHERQKHEEKRLAHMQGESLKLKTTLLTLYKQHIDLLDQLPVQGTEAPKETPAAPAQQKAPAESVKEESRAETKQPAEMAAPTRTKAPARPAAPAPAPKKQEPPEEQTSLQELFAPEGDGFAVPMETKTVGTDGFENYQGIQFDD